MKVFIYPPNNANVTVPPIQFNVDGVATTVNKDTLVPANSVGLPVELLNNPVISGSVSVSNFPVTQAVSGTVTANLGTIAGVATETTLSSIDTKVITTANGIKVDGSAVTQPVSGTVTANLGTISGVATETTLSSIDTKVITTANGIKVDGSAVTQPVSGTVTANLGTIAGVATETSLSSLLNKTSGSLIPFSYNNVVVTYVGTTTNISTVVYKQGATTVATLTLTYDGSNRLIDVTRS